MATKLRSFAHTVALIKIQVVFVTKFRKRYAEELKPYYWKPLFWKRGFSAVSCGGAPLSVLKQYIENQGYDD